MGDILAKNLRRVGHLDIPGGGQVVVEDGYAYVGHMKPLTAPASSTCAIRHGRASCRQSNCRPTTRIPTRCGW